MSDIYLVDDHAMLRDGLKAVLEDAGHRVVGESADPTAALAEIVRLAPSVVLLDLHLGLRSGFAAVRDCDLLLCLGTGFEWRQFYPPRAKIVQVDIDPQSFL